MRILVFSRAHAQFPWMSTFPHVRGHILATHLRQLGEDADFRTLPVAGHYDVAICSDYQGDARWMASLEREMAGLTARRMFCMADSGRMHHFSTPMLDWFARRGGVLCHLRHGDLAPQEHYIGVGVDAAVRPDPPPARGAVFFDFPRSQRNDASLRFAPERLAAVRRAHPHCRLIGSGPTDSAIQGHFDEWIGYGVPHDEYVRTFARCFAFVPGGQESMGLAVAEAQMAGAAIVVPVGWIRTEMLVPAAAIIDADPVRGIERAMLCDAEQIAREAAEQFSAIAMASRVMAAIRPRHRWTLMATDGHRASAPPHPTPPLDWEGGVGLGLGVHLWPSVSICVWK